MEICAEALFFSCEDPIEQADFHQTATFPAPILLTLQWQLEGMGAAWGGWVIKGDGRWWWWGALLERQKEGICCFAHELHF